MENYIKLDYSLESQEDRVKKVEEIISTTPSERLTPFYLTKLADYILEEEKKTKKIITNNRQQRISVRETSFEGLVTKFENGEDGIYNLITNDKNILFRPKDKINAEDLDRIPFLRELHEETLKVDAESRRATGKRAFALKQQVKEMWQDQYIIKAAYKKPIYCMNLNRSIPKLDLTENVAVSGDTVISDGLVNFFDAAKVSALLCNYARLKEDSWDKLNGDAKWLMEDFDNLVCAALEESHPLYYDLVIAKIDGRTNLEIQSLLFDKYNIKHSIEYISSLWRNKIPKLVAETAVNEYLNWYYTFIERGIWKKCGRCGEIKLAHPNFFSRNRASKDGCYSICKYCRSKKNK